MKRAFPSKSELDALVNAQDWEALKKRAKECTPENMIAAAIQRRKDNAEPMLFPLDIFRKIAVYMDIRQVLELGNTNIMFQSFLVSNGFWAEKFANDFPEVLVLLVKVDFTLNFPHRNLYNVVRYMILNDVYRLFCLRNVVTRFTLDEVYFEFVFDRKRLCFTRSVFVSTPIHPRGLQVGDMVELSIDDMITQHVGDRTKYLLDMNTTLSNCIKRPGSSFCIGGDDVSFRECVKRGYFKKRDNKIVIG